MTDDVQTTTAEMPNAPILKRLFALGYDLFILLAMSMAYSAIATIIMNQALDIEAVDYQPMERGPWFLVGWVLTIVAFYWFFWYRAGQTVGMKTWRIKVISRKDSGKDSKLTHLQCFIRIIVGPFSLAVLGIGYFWRWVDKDKLTLHDRLSNTRVVLMPKVAKKEKPQT